MNLTCYLIDDESHALDLLRDYIAQTPGLKLAGAGTRPLAALNEIQELRPDVTFMDVDMPELSGLDLAELVRNSTMVVFTTSYREFGPEAYERDALDYLLKPISYPRFLKCLEKLKHREVPSPDHFYVKTGAKGVLQKIVIRDISYVSGLGAYMELHTTGGKVVTHGSLTELANRLPGATFSRIHKSYLVNHDHLLAIDGGQVKLAGGTCLTIGRAYRASFFEKIDPALLISQRG